MPETPTTIASKRAWRTRVDSKRAGSGAKVSTKSFVKTVALELITELRLDIAAANRPETTKPGKPVGRK